MHLGGSRAGGLFFQALKESKEVQKLAIWALPYRSLKAEFVVKMTFGLVLGAVVE